MQPNGLLIITSITMANAVNRMRENKNLVRSLESFFIINLIL